MDEQLMKSWKSSVKKNPQFAKALKQYGQNKPPGSDKTYAELVLEKQKEITEKEKWTYIYFLLCPYKDGWAVKVGKSHHPEKRKATLQSGNPCKFETLKCVRQPPEMENKLHEALKFWRVNDGGKEWFIWNEDTCGIICNESSWDNL